MIQIPELRFATGSLQSQASVHQVILQETNGMQNPAMGRFEDKAGIKASSAVASPLPVPLDSLPWNGLGTGIVRAGKKALPPLSPRLLCMGPFSPQSQRHCSHSCSRRPTVWGPAQPQLSPSSAQVELAPGGRARPGLAPADRGPYQGRKGCSLPQLTKSFLFGEAWAHCPVPVEILPIFSPLSWLPQV